MEPDSLAVHICEDAIAITEASLPDPASIILPSHGPCFDGALNQSHFDLPHVGQRLGTCPPQHPAAMVLVVHAGFRVSSIFSSVARLLIGCAPPDLATYEVCGASGLRPLLIPLLLARAIASFASSIAVTPRSRSFLSCAGSSGAAILSHHSVLTAL